MSGGVDIVVLVTSYPDPKEETMTSEEILPEIDPKTGRLLCDHVGEETVTRIAHGYLGDAPRGTRQTLCAACGFLLEEVLAPTVCECGPDGCGQECPAEAAR